MSAVELNLSISLLIGVGNSQARTLQGLPNTTNLVVAPIVQRCSCRRFCHSIPLKEGYAKSMEQLQYVGIDWGRPGDSVRHIGEANLSRSLLLDDATKHGYLEESELAAQCGHEVRVDLLIDSRNSYEQVRLNLLAVVNRVQRIIHHSHVHGVTNPEEVVS